MKTFPMRFCRFRFFLGTIAPVILLGLLLWPALLPPLSPVEAATPDAASVVVPADLLARRSDLLQQLGVRPWHAQGYHGQGLKVAVLDSGFSGYRAHLGKALPARVTTHSFRFDGDLEARDSQHGILCAEVIHALAPQAEILLANWEPESPDQFLAAVRWARQEGARILSCSVIMPTWSDYEGHGRIHEELTRILGRGDDRGDLLCFASAGNTAERHWFGPFRDGGDGYHDWVRDEKLPQTDNPLKPWGGERVSVELCCPADATYELSVYDKLGHRLIGRRMSGRMNGLNTAVVGFEPDTFHNYTVRVRQLRSGSGPFHLVVLGGSLHHSSCRGSIPFPGDGAEVIAVGAVDQGGRRLHYSSCGPKQTGVKPDFVACVPFPSSWRLRPFAGTSAAAPQAAGLAALVWSQHLDWMARQVRDSLRNAARSGSSSSSIWETGYGRIHLPPLVPASSPSGKPRTM
jgi:hypothetical protein